jgi:hypothetical protein
MAMRTLIRQFLTAWKIPRWRWAIIAAVASDGVGLALALTPPAFWVLDVVTVVLLFVLLGFRWSLVPALIFEMVPGLQVFPAWTLVVMALAAVEDKKLLPKVDGPRQDP